LSFKEKGMLKVFAWFMSIHSCISEKMFCNCGVIFLYETKVAKKIEQNVGSPRLCEVFILFLIVLTQTLNLPSQTFIYIYRVVLTIYTLL
jgi:hypothetical protein